MTIAVLYLMLAAVWPDPSGVYDHYDSTGLRSNWTVIIYPIRQGYAADWYAWDGRQAKGTFSLVHLGLFRMFGGYKDISVPFRWYQRGTTLGGEGTDHELRRR